MSMIDIVRAVCPDSSLGKRTELQSQRFCLSYLLVLISSKLEIKVEYQIKRDPRQMYCLKYPTALILI